MLDIYFKAKENYSGKIMSLEAITFMSEATVDRPPSLASESAAPADRSTGLPPRPGDELHVQNELLKPPIVLKNRLLGGIFLPEYYADLGYMDGIVHRVDKDRKIIRPFLASVIAGRVNNPYLLIEPTDTAIPSCREADDVGALALPMDVVRKRGIKGAEVIASWYARPGGQEDVGRLLRIFADKKISARMLSRQRIKDIGLIRQAGALLGVDKARLDSTGNGNGSTEAYTPRNVLGESYQEGTYAIVDRLIREHGADDDHPLIQYEASIDESTGKETVVVDRTITFPSWVAEPRQELKEGTTEALIKKINIESALSQLTDAQRQGYEFYADVMYFLGDPLIRTALNPPSKHPRVTGPYEWGEFPKLEDIFRLPRDIVLGLIRR